MLKLNTDEKRTLQFEVSIQGIDYKELTGSLKFIIENVEYGFPVKILADHIAVDVPPLDDIVLKGLVDDSVAECKLDIFGNGFYLNPWTGNFKLKTPVKMEAKMRYAEDIVSYEPPEEPVVEDAPPKKSMKAILRENDEIEIEEPTLSEGDLDKEELLEMLFDRLDTPSDYRQTVKKMVKPKPQKQQKALVKQKVQSKLSEMSNLVDKFLTPRTKKKTRRPVKQQISIENISDPVTLMDSLGMKNKKTQKILLERAEVLGGGDNKSMIRTLKQMLTNQKTLSTFEEYTKREHQKQLGELKDE